MTSSNSLEKKSYSKIILHVVIIGIVGFIFIMLGNMIDVNRKNYADDRAKVISKYESEIKKADSLNTQLKSQQIVLLNKVDSLESVKTKIILAYDKKIKSIYDASAVEHALWLESTIAKLDSTKAK